MKFYAIPPVKHMGLTHCGDRYFCLAHLYVKHPSYRDFFHTLRCQDKHAFITLDNGAAEHSLVTGDVLLQITEELQPTEVIAPDILFDASATIEATYSFIDKLFSSPKTINVEVFACPQGSTKDEYSECLTNFVVSNEINRVGLSKIAVPKAYRNATGDVDIAVSRNELVSDLVETDLIDECNFHLLGMGEFTEFDYYMNSSMANIQSSDSCYSILAAIHGLEFERGENERIPTPHDYFDYEMNPEQIDRAIRNISFLKRTYGN